MYGGFRAAESADLVRPFAHRVEQSASSPEDILSVFRDDMHPLRVIDIVTTMLSHVHKSTEKLLSFAVAACSSRRQTNASRIEYCHNTRSLGSSLDIIAGGSDTGRRDHVRVS